MVETKAEALVKSVESLLAEKEAVAAKEKELIAALNAALTKIGFEVVPLAGRASGKVGRPRGRPPGRPRKRRPGRPPKAEAKRRGRPPKEG